MILSLLVCPINFIVLNVVPISIYYADPSILLDLLVTHKSFTTSEQLLDLLIRRFKEQVQVPPNNGNGNGNNNNNNATPTPSTSSKESSTNDASSTNSGNDSDAGSESRDSEDGESAEDVPIKPSLVHYKYGCICVIAVIVTVLKGYIMCFVRG